MMDFEQHPTEPNTLVIKMRKRYIAKHSDEDLQAAVLAEREACAKLCDELDQVECATAGRGATAIRGRTE
jgi:hypothetical protein